MAVQLGDLGEVAVVSIGAAVAIVFVFALGVRAVAAVEDAEAGRGALPLAAAVLCFLACGAAVLYGLYLIIPQLH
jgi:hypothetical protein